MCSVVGQDVPIWSCCLARIDWTAKLRKARRLLATAPVVLAAFGVAMAASSTPRPEIDRRAEAVRALTGGDLGERGMAAITGPPAHAVRRCGDSPVFWLGDWWFKPET